MPGLTTTSNQSDHVQVTELPGYRIERVLGHGGMGTVYLARQMSLDRPVALKVMSRQWGSDPVFVGRFVREAYAAALLNHPNVVQIHDIGEAGGLRYFSMEYVAGRSFSDLIHDEGSIPPETAVGYILQAARGLKHAHDRGLIHRDVKPDNLLLNEHGQVKVADLGLVKTPEPGAALDLTDSGSGLSSLPPDMTGTAIALGTPMYMAPEQCRDAATVDHRADIYSLGCTLYALVTGRPPYEGGSAMELMTQHAYRPLVPPENFSSRIPQELSAIIQRMMAKSPEDRYPDMGEVVRVLERWLGVREAGRYSPKHEQIEILECFAKSFRELPTVRRRYQLVTTLVTSSSAAALIMLSLGQSNVAFGLAVMVLAGCLVSFLLNGIARKTEMYVRLRHFVAEFTSLDWLLVGSGLGFTLLILGIQGYLGICLGFGAAGALAAFLLRYTLDQAIDRERTGPLDATRQLIRRIRLSGVDEEELRLFIAKYSGPDWEEFFEHLFGFEAKLSTRARMPQGNGNLTSTGYAVWREPLLNLIDQVARARREARGKQWLERIGQNRPMNIGLTFPETGSDHKHHSFLRYRLKPEAKPAKAQPEPAAQSNTPGRNQRLIGWLLEIPLSKTFRTVAAAILVAGFLLWVYQNGLFADPKLLSETDGGTVPRLIQPLQLNGVPAFWTAWCDSITVGWAGLLLMLSLYYQGKRAALLALIGVGVTLFGTKIGIQSAGPLQDFHITMLIGTVFAMTGFRLAPEERR